MSLDGSQRMLIGVVLALLPISGCVGRNFVGTDGPSDLGSPVDAGIAVRDATLFSSGFDAGSDLGHGDLGPGGGFGGFGGGGNGGFGGFGRHDLGLPRPDIGAP